MSNGHGIDVMESLNKVIMSSDPLPEPKAISPHTQRIIDEMKDIVHDAMTSGFDDWVNGERERCNANR